MRLVIKSVVPWPGGPVFALPARATLERRIPGPDRSDYWLAKLEEGVSWGEGDALRRIEYVLLSPRWEGTMDGHGIDGTPVRIACVIDESLLRDEALDFSKCAPEMDGVASGI